MDASSKNPLLNEHRVLQYCMKKKIKICIDAVDYFEEENGYAYLVCKYMGISLREYLITREPINTSIAIKFIKQISIGMQKLHE